MDPLVRASRGGPTGGRQAGPVEGERDGPSASSAAIRDRYQDLVDHLPVALYVNRNDRIVFANAACAALLGVASPDELIGRNPLEFYDPADHAMIRERTRTLRSGRVSVPPMLHRVVTADGRRLDVEVQASSFDDDGVWATHAVLRDVTEQRRALELEVQAAHDVDARRLAEEESDRRGARLEALAEVARVLASARSEREVTAVVPRVARLLVDADGANLFVREGERCREAAEEAMEPLWKGARPPGWDGICRPAMDGGGQLSIENLFDDPRIPSDAYRTTSIRSLAVTPVGRGTPRAAIGVYWTTRHAATAMELEMLRALADSTSIALENIATWNRLRQSEGRYRQLIESLDDLVYSVDPDGRITYVSAAASNYGYTPEEVVGHRFQDFAHPDDREMLDRAFEERLSEDVGPYEYRVIDRAGKVRFVRSSGRRVFEGSRFVGLAGVLIDLTAQRSAEEQLRVSQKIEAIGRLAGGIAHDFNNLLTVISSYAGLASRGLSEDDLRRAELAEIRKAGDRASALTRQLLAFSRRQVLKPDVLDVNALVTGMERMLSRLIGEDVDLRVSRAPDLGRIRADPGQVEQVLMNLAVNARDAMPDGGRLLIETENAELDADFVSRHHGARAGAFVRLRVTDTGHGMDAATRERLFEPFFTTKPAGKGTGLGLATVYGIVKQSGGSIWVASEPGRGAIFDVYFPRLDEEPSATPHPNAPTLYAGGQGRLLFVEDDDAVRALAARVLREAGYDVALAANGAEALLLAERHRGGIDLVVTDVVMPGMNGRELAERLEPLLRGAPVLFLSGHSHDAIGRHGVLDPGILFLAKPFTPETLVEKVREILGR